MAKSTRTILHNSFNLNTHEHVNDDGRPAVALEFDLPNGDALIFPLSAGRSQELHDSVGETLSKPIVAKPGDVEAEAAATAGGKDLSGVGKGGQRSKARRS